MVTVLAVMRVSSKSWRHVLGRRQAEFGLRRMVVYFDNSAGYGVIIDEETDNSIYEHELCALAAGFDPDEVFAEDTQIHHLMHTPQKAGVKIDTPESVMPVSEEVHREIHEEDGPYCEVSQVLTD